MNTLEKYFVIAFGLILIYFTVITVRYYRKKRLIRRHQNLLYAIKKPPTSIEKIREETKLVIKTQYFDYTGEYAGFEEIHQRLKAIVGEKDFLEIIKKKPFNNIPYPPTFGFF